MSFWTDFEAELATAAKAIESEFVTLATQIKPLLIASAEELATLALNAVASEAPKVLSGQEKLSNATSTVVTSLASQGKTVLASAAEAAVQVSYNFLSALLHPTK